MNYEISTYVAITEIQVPSYNYRTQVVSHVTTNYGKTKIAERKQSIVRNSTW